MKSLKEKVAALTGGASGIGRATAIRLAREGCHLALSDVNETGLAETARECRALGVKVTTGRLDVADRDAMQAWAEDVVARHGRVNLIINNAGVGLGSTISDLSYEDFEWLMGINFWGVVYGTKAFLPLLKASGDGHVVNISSIFGIVAVPTQGAYNAAKFAVRGFTEALREEMEIEGAPVGVTCIHPGGIKTNIARNARFRLGNDWGMKDQSASVDEFDRMAHTTPEQAADAIVAAILGNRRRQLIGTDARVLDLAQRLMPAGYQRLLVAFGKRQRNKGSDDSA